MKRKKKPKAKASQYRPAPPSFGFSPKTSQKKAAPQAALHFLPPFTRPQHPSPGHQHTAPQLRSVCLPSTDQPTLALFFLSTHSRSSPHFLSSSTYNTTALFPSTTANTPSILSFPSRLPLLLHP